VIGVLHTLSQCLRTGEPLHETYNISLIDHVFYHRSLAPRKNDDCIVKEPLEFVQTMEFMSYSTAVCAVFQLLDVCISVAIYLFTLTYRF
jgi:hypothetical protein